MEEWLRIAWSASVRRRATRIAIVVGSVLIAINHGDAILEGKITRARLFRMLLTIIVPYVVSTVSSVGALRELRRPASCRETGAGADSHEDFDSRSA